MIKIFDDETFLEFLLKAKKSTYAAQGDRATVSPLLPGSKQLEYSEGNFFYRDIYFGFTKFVGQETIYLESLPVWSMCYAGGIISDEIKPLDVFIFLQSALKQMDSAMPYRGPKLLENIPFSYSNTVFGDINRFHGAEKIVHNGSDVYELHYAGGIFG
jgi:hypothetical protein